MSELRYANFSPDQLARYTDNWYELVDWWEEEDWGDAGVSIPRKSLDLFEFLLKGVGTPVRLQFTDDVIAQPDDVAPWVLSRFGDMPFEPYRLAPAEVAAIAAVLGRHPFDALVAGTDPDEMAAAGVALVPDRGRRKDYDKSFYEELARFFADAATKGEGMILLDN
ncbi:DUF1877 family protein [Rhizohabitans arisaemae]|uniref:DUF1877 family protein n=1 Tax=Rhizohabitans arisaemae TaxID=2720610 RepID=UPI0024B1D8EE|nr:DUF1877 family protein [Rhizohabitans arisaemae]